MELEEVFAVGNSLCRKIIRFFRDDPCMPLEVPNGSATKRRLFRGTQLLEWDRLERGGHTETLATGSAIMVAGVCQ